eukprot:5375259-Amphidinium_carterae.1
MEAIIAPYTSGTRISAEIPPNIVLTSESNTLRLGGARWTAAIWEHISTSLGLTARLLHNQQILGAHPPYRWHDQLSATLGNIKPITVDKLDIRNKEKKTEGIWLGKTTNSGEHIIATMHKSGKAFYTWSLTRLTPELQWGKKVHDKIIITQMDTSMNEDYMEEEHIGKTIIDELFTKTRLNEKQS